MKRKISTYKLHELRMWIVQIIIPGILGVIMLRQNPQIKAWMDRQVSKIKYEIIRMWEKIKLNYQKLKVKFSKN